MSEPFAIGRRGERIPLPLPECICPPSYVRDVCNGHPETECKFHGLFGPELMQAMFTATFPDGIQGELSL